MSTLEAVGVILGKPQPPFLPMNEPVYTPKFQECWKAIQDEIAETIRYNELTLGNFLSEEDTNEIVKTVFRRKMRELGSEERMRNLYKIKDKLTQQFIQYKPNKHQEEFRANKTNRNCILKVRQVGFTTDSCIYALDRALFDDWNTGIMAHKQKPMMKLFDIIKNAYDFFVADWGEFYQPQVNLNNSNEISWNDTKASITVALDFQSRTVIFLHVSEAHFISTERITNSLQAVPDTGEITLETTPNGRGGFFFKRWDEWKHLGPGAPYKGYFVPWFEHYPEDPEAFIPPKGTIWTQTEEDLRKAYHLEDYHLFWRRRIKAEKCDDDDDIFDVQYPSDDEACFLAGSYNVFKKATLTYQNRFVVDPKECGELAIEEKFVKFRPQKKGGWRIYEYPKAGRNYSMGVDTSTETGHDPGVICIIDNGTGAQVAVFSGYLDSELMADEIYKGGQYYHKAHACIEVNNTGLAVILALQPKYFNLYRRQIFDDPTKKFKTKIGFYTSTTTKNTIIDNLTAQLREGGIKVKDQQTFNEMTTFIHVIRKTSDGRMQITNQKEASVGCFDDHVIALALAQEMRRAHPTEFAMEPTMGSTNYDSEDYVDPDETYSL